MNTSAAAASSPTPIETARVTSPLAQEDQQVHLLVDTQTQAWDVGVQDAKFLLTGPELERANAWASREDADPAATVDHRLYLEASGQLKTRRNYRTLAVVVGFFAAIVFGRALAQAIIHSDAQVSGKTPQTRSVAR